VTLVAKGLYVPPNQETNILNVIRAVQALARGQTNAQGSFTLSTGVTATTVSNPLVGANSIITWRPKTANAAAQMAVLSCAATDTTTGQFILHHGAASTSTGNAAFNYTINS